MKFNLHKYFTMNDTLFVGAFIVALALAWNTVGAMQRNYRLEQRFNQLQADVELYELENENLRYQIAYLKSDDYLELAARDKFNKAAPGETLVYLPRSKKLQEPRVSVSSNLPIQPRPEPDGWRANVGAWWRFLTGQHG